MWRLKYKWNAPLPVICMFLWLPIADRVGKWSLRPGSAVVFTGSFLDIGSTHVYSSAQLFSCNTLGVLSWPFLALFHYLKPSLQPHLRFI